MDKETHTTSKSVYPKNLLIIGAAIILVGELLRLGIPGLFQGSLLNACWSGMLGVLSGLIGLIGLIGWIIVTIWIVGCGVGCNTSLAS